MNIFHLDADPQVSARYHNDPHLTKNAPRNSSDPFYRGSATTYRPTHKNHPCVLWAAESQSNYNRLFEIGECLGQEFFRRRNWKRHKSIEYMLESLNPNKINNLPDIPGTPPPHCMPDNVKVSGDSVRSYRQYVANFKRHCGVWSEGGERLPRPSWFDDESYRVGLSEEEIKDGITHLDNFLALRRLTQNEYDEHRAWLEKCSGGVDSSPR